MDFDKNTFDSMLIIEKYSRLGHLEAKQLYDRIVGVYQDEAHKDFSLQLREAYQGQGESCYKIGKCYSEGVGVAKDLSEAIIWLVLLVCYVQLLRIAYCHIGRRRKRHRGFAG